MSTLVLQPQHASRRPRNDSFGWISPSSACRWREDVPPLRVLGQEHGSRVLGSEKATLDVVFVVVTKVSRVPDMKSPKSQVVSITKKLEVLMKE